MKKSATPAPPAKGQPAAHVPTLPLTGGIVTNEDGSDFRLPTYEEAEERFFSGESSDLEDFVNHCTPPSEKEHDFREKLLAAIEEAHARGYVAAKREMSENPGPELRQLREDRARLNWLDNCRHALNEHCGSTLGWEVIRSHNLNRIMVRSPYHGEMATVDVNDAARGGRDIRRAIDEAIRRSSVGTDAPALEAGATASPCPMCGCPRGGHQPA